MAVYTPGPTRAPRESASPFIPKALKSRYINEKRMEWGKLISRVGIALAILLLIVFFLGKGIWIGGDAADKSMHHNKIARSAIEKIGWSARSITFIRQVSYGEMKALVPPDVEASANSWCGSSSGFLTGEYRIRGASGAPNGEKDLVVWVATPNFFMTWCGMVIMSDGWKHFEDRTNALRRGN